MKHCRALVIILALTLAQISCDVALSDIMELVDSFATVPPSSVSPAPSSPEPAPESSPALTIHPTGEPIITGSVTYDVQNTLTITNQGPGAISRLEVTIALIRDYAPYQDVTSFQATPVETLPRVTDEYGNEYAYYEFFSIPPGGSASIDLQYRVVVNELYFEATTCQGGVIDAYLGSEEYIDTFSAELQDVAATIAVGQSDPCVISRAIYDYVIDTLDYIAYNPGDVGASGALADGGGDCTEFADLTVALHRIRGIPANFLEGLTYDPVSDGRVTYNEAKHDWTEIYLPGVGWAPVDSTWGRNSWQDQETYFAGMTADHIVVTSGRNLPPLEGGHFYLWYYWWETLETSVEDEETWTITRVRD
jgi:transglutaminase-like putative cysteine protease